MQRIDPNGARLWVPEGVNVRPVPGVGVVSSPVLVSSGSGTTVVAWMDNRNSLDGDIYTQKLDTDANQLWDPDDVPVCLASSLEEELVAVGDSTGGAIVTRTDWRNSSADIYANRVTGSGIVAVEDRPVPAFRLLAPRPNPSAGEIELRIDLPAPTEVSVRVFDMAGRVVRTLAVAQTVPAGVNVLRWDARDDAHRRVAAGIYFLHVEVGHESGTRRAVILR